MKGAKTFAVGNGTSKRFQSDDIIVKRVHLPGDIELVETLIQMLAQNKKLTATVTELQLKLKKLKINLIHLKLLNKLI